MVAVCNTLAFNNPDEDSDIDLFIVSQNKRLFITRTLITILTSILKVRRHGSKVEGRFCLSFWCTEKVLDFEDLQIEGGDPYLAYWIKDLKPIFGEKTHQNMLNLNKKWMENYCHPKYYEGSYCLGKDSSPKLRMTQALKQFLEWALKNRIGNLIEKLLQKWQIARCEAKNKNLDARASIIISPDMLKFHNIDMRRAYRDRWLEALPKQ